MRVVSGIQPTGKPHLGNYLGAIVNYVKLQEEAQAAGGECLIFLADLHAISMPHKPVVLHAATLEMVATLVACGVDPAKAIPFNQAQVPAHAEMQWLLNGTARMGWLNRMTQWKDKAGKNREGASAALVGIALQVVDVLLASLATPARTSASGTGAASPRSSTTSPPKMRRSSRCPIPIFPKTRHGSCRYATARRR